MAMAAQTTAVVAQTTAHPAASQAAQFRDDAYLAELLGFSLERLAKEPELLAADASRASRAALDAALRDYRGFIAASRCLAEARTSNASVNGSLDQLSNEALPRLEKACSTFHGAASDAASKRDAQRRLASMQGTLCELFEIPELMTACARNEAFDEVLDLYALVEKGVLLHPDSRVMRSVAEACARVRLEAVDDLLHRLRNATHLPECLRVVGYLRRASALSEDDLQRVFLDSRTDHLATAVARASAGSSGAAAAEGTAPSAYERLKRITDVHRVHLFDAAMQYRAMFGDGAQEHNYKGGDVSESADPLREWSGARVSNFLSQLEHGLANLEDGASVAGVLEHAMYCGASLGRVGYDFRALLAPLFEQRFAAIFASGMETAVRVFRGSLDAHRWSTASPMSAVSSTDGDGDDAQKGASAPAGGASSPPYALMSHPPLACLCNGVLNSLNELRHGASPRLAAPLGALFLAALHTSASELANHAIARDLTVTGDEGRAHLQACRAFVEIFVPFASSCFRSTFSPVAGGALTALNSDDLAEALAPLTALVESAAE
ncbi:hypothetical protein PPROV_000051000 [Pycnococcus provasolii]|uniref:Conserved oligomeric Golgi complex subunit 8 n=2 Tax=Pycnococcus provasolii TaxID=41880 RepID=A0A830H643_9CHLO|nr:hypothetical protein PPROV_000051000 [Pycnococcus provasolii]